MHNPLTADHLQPRCILSTLPVVGRELQYPPKTYLPTGIVWSSLELPIKDIFYIVRLVCIQYFPNIQRNDGFDSTGEVHTPYRVSAELQI